MKNTATIHITGKVNDASVDELNEFEIVREKLLALGFTDVTTAIEQLPTGDEFKNEDAYKQHLALRNKHLAEADVVVYLSNYEDDSKARLDVLARLNQQKNTIMSVTTFLKRYAEGVAA
ncbi:MAG: DUF4406 domain-containing protein [Sediminibacterium sp.]